MVTVPLPCQNGGQIRESHGRSRTTGANPDLGRNRSEAGPERSPKQPLTSQTRAHPSNQVSNDRCHQRRTPADTDGRRCPGQRCLVPESQCRLLTKRPPVQTRPPRPRSRTTCELRRWPHPPAEWLPLRQCPEGCDGMATSGYVGPTAVRVAGGRRWERSSRPALLRH